MTKDDIIRMALEAGFFPSELTQVGPSVEKFAELIAKDEREACAKVCEAQGEYGWQQYADAIRARGDIE